MSNNDDSRFEMVMTIGSHTFSARGSREVVMDALGQFKELVSATEIDDTSGGGSSADADQLRNTQDKSKGKTSKAQPIGAFMKREWGSQKAMVTGVAVWAKRHDKKESSKPSDLKTYVRRTSIKVPGNISQVVKNAEKEGWLHGEGGGQYSVTGPGESMVDATPSKS